MSTLGTTEVVHGLKCAPNCTAQIDGQSVLVMVHTREGLAPEHGHDYTIRHAGLDRQGARIVPASAVTGLSRAMGQPFGDQDHVIVFPRSAL